MTGVDDGDFYRRLAAAVARPESGAVGGDGRRGREGATVRRASTPDDRWRRGRSSDPMVAAEAEIFMVASLCALRLASVESLRKESLSTSPE